MNVLFISSRLSRFHLSIPLPFHNSFVLDEISVFHQQFVATAGVQYILRQTPIDWLKSKAIDRSAQPHILSAIHFQTNEKEHLGSWVNFLTFNVWEPQVYNQLSRCSNNVSKQLICFFAEKDQGLLISFITLTAVNYTRMIGWWKQKQPISFHRF